MTQQTVAIIDSGGANIASLRFALQRLGVEGILTTDKNVICGASHVILPGVGAAADAMGRLRSSNLDSLIPALAQPVLGICLGMQLLAEGSDEDSAHCLGIVPGTAKRLSASPDNPVPNMGWARIAGDRSHPLLNGIDDRSYFYFLHSYVLPIDNYTVATSVHTETFTAILSRDNFHATQFHPERSSANGARLLRNFIELPA